MKAMKLVLAGAAAISLASFAQAETYTFTASADYSGPFADVMPDSMSGLEAIVDYWNAEVGEGLGVDVDLKIYDMRYNSAQIARTWPSILRSDAPIIHLGWGSPDLVTLMGRLPNDKVPLLLGTAMGGQGWTENGWHFSTRPTYSHEFAGLFSYLAAGHDGPLKIAAISTQTQAGFVDQVEGVKQLATQYPDSYTLTSTQWADTAPVSLAPQMRKALADDPDVILVGGTTAQVIETAKAMEELGANVPIVMSTHNGLAEVSKGLPLDRIEGSYSTFSFAPPGKENLPIRDVFETYAPDGNWGTMAEQSAAQAILALRVLEQAVAEVGADNVTGQAMYDALIGHTYSEERLLGALPTLSYDTTAPFPTGEIKSSAEVVKDGQVVPVQGDWFAVPVLDKW
ncbi:ABC transporter substrate-binding protein [Marinobacter sp. ATCH36]|uniref:ABC transporter substrate-binding protein n=1 Tax=Marinobacter sp. ATCH36 TaxID=2945106 RepID=UPI0020228A9A|nr:ABC transporter substrate-binding protein [Marinobacter sp. ATCH36]MCL7946159.1 ABC transporter substrate-binding protein [Marinobacter sp. ATCH36]